MAGRTQRNFAKTYVSRAWFFFFSSRRRHTRFDCDWSSDVCSSDLAAVHQRLEAEGLALRLWQGFRQESPVDTPQQHAHQGQEPEHCRPAQVYEQPAAHQDRKSTRLNSSHSQISYAVFCLKKKIHIQPAIHASTSAPPPSLTLAA